MLTLLPPPQKKSTYKLVYFRILLNIYVRFNENCNFWIFVCICNTRKTITSLQCFGTFSMLHGCSKITASGRGFAANVIPSQAWRFELIIKHSVVFFFLIGFYIPYGLFLVSFPKTYFLMGQMKTPSMCSLNNDVCFILVPPGSAPPAFLLLFSPSLSSFLTSVFLTMFLQATAIFLNIVFGYHPPSIFFPGFKKM